MYNTRTFYGTDGTLTIASQTAMEPDALTTYLREGNQAWGAYDHFFFNQTAIPDQLHPNMTMEFFSA